MPEYCMRIVRDARVEGSKDNVKIPWRTIFFNSDTDEHAMQYAKEELASLVTMTLDKLNRIEEK